VIRWKSAIWLEYVSIYTSKVVFGVVFDIDNCEVAMHYSGVWCTKNVRNTRVVTMWIHCSRRRNVLIVGFFII